MSRLTRFSLYGTLSFVVMATFAGYLTIYASVTERYADKRPVWIPPGSDIEAVADSLESSGILEHRRRFSLFAIISGWGNQIKAGHYLIPSGSSNHGIFSMLRRGLQEPVRVTVPAGTRRERIARAIAANMAFSESDARSVMSDTAFASTLETDTTQLMGYMLPDTYFFFWLTDVHDVFKRIKIASEEEIRHARSNGGEDKLSTDDVLKLASIVEWETSYVPEKARIAGVYLNRLRDGWPLQADPTVQYAVMQSEGQKRRLLFADYRIKHPYNTYNFRGLPPGPVTNPSATSIEAVLKPEHHKYYYFVAKGDGGHLFSQTLAEHNKRAKEYRAMMRIRRSQQAAAEASK